MIGRDFARDSDSPGRALIQFDNYFAWLEGNSATILRPGQPALLARYDSTNGQLQIDDHPPTAKQIQNAMAHVILPSLLYRERRYRLPE